jgi:hypothetical protein
VPYLEPQWREPARSGLERFQLERMRLAERRPERSSLEKSSPE